MEFVDKPPPGAEPGTRGRHSERGQTLREHPGQWAVFGTYRSLATAAAAASRLKGGTLKWAPRGSVEAVAREVDGVARVYARWVA